MAVHRWKGGEKDGDLSVKGSKNSRGALHAEFCGLERPSRKQTDRVVAAHLSFGMSCSESLNGDLPRNALAGEAGSPASSWAHSCS